MFAEFLKELLGLNNTKKENCDSCGEKILIDDSRGLCEKCFEDNTFLLNAKEKEWWIILPGRGQRKQGPYTMAELWDFAKDIPVEADPGENDYASVRRGKDGEWARVKRQDFYPRNIYKVARKRQEFYQDAVNQVSWYQREDTDKSVRQVVVDIEKSACVEPKFGMMILGAKYHLYRTNTWTTGYFRMDTDAGPYLLIRADGYTEQLKCRKMRVSHCFYRMKEGGLFAIFVDFPEMALPDVPSSPFVLFEMIRGIDMEDERQRIKDAINSPKLHICFAEGDGVGEEVGGVWRGGGINCVYDVVVDIDEDCRSALNEEWESLLEYHSSLPSDVRDFNASVQQMQEENPLSINPIISEDIVAPRAKAIVLAQNWDGLLLQLKEQADEGNLWAYTNGYVPYEEYPQYQNIRRIGQKIFDLEGQEGMKRAFYEIKRTCMHPGGYDCTAHSVVNYSWANIGGWLP